MMSIALIHQAIKRKMVPGTIFVLAVMAAGTARADTITLSSDLTAASLTINAGDTLLTKGYNITVSGNLVIVGTGTLDATDIGAGTSGHGSVIMVGGDWTMDP